MIEVNCEATAAHVLRSEKTSKATLVPVPVEQCSRAQESILSPSNLRQTVAAAQMY